MFGFTRSVLARLALLVASLAVALAITETGCRYFLGESLAITTDERNLLYRYDATLGWFPSPSTERRFLGERWIDVRHNRLGLRDIEFPAKDAQRPRIAFFGDSFVWGYDADAPERFTNLIREHHPEWDVVNCGVSGYGTDQATLLLERLGPVLHPDVVVLEFNRADRNDNILSENLGGYGKPVFDVRDGALFLQNVPVPLLNKSRWSESALYRHSYAWRFLIGATAVPRLAIAVMEDPTERLVDRMREQSAAIGARFVILLEGSDDAMVAHASTHGIPVVEVEPAFQARASPAVPLRYTGHGAHWTPEGNRVVASLLEPAIASALRAPD